MHSRSSSKSLSRVRSRSPPSRRKPSSWSPRRGPSPSRRSPPRRVPSLSPSQPPGQDVLAETPKTPVPEYFWHGTGFGLIAGGDDFAVTLNNDATISITHWNIEPPETYQLTIKNVICIAAGSSHIAFVSKSGQGFVYNTLSRSTSALPFYRDHPYVGVACSLGYSAFLTSTGRVVEWSDLPRPGVPIRQPRFEQIIVAIAVGYFHNVYLLNDGMVATAGDNYGYQLGDGTNQSRDFPVILHDLTNIIAIDACQHISGAVSGDGRVAIWGKDKRRPYFIPGINDARGIALGSDGIVILHNTRRLSFSSIQGIFNFGNLLFDPIEGTDNVEAVACDSSIPSKVFARRFDGTVAVLTLPPRRPVRG
jgi:hypothetical protein